MTNFTNKLKTRIVISIAVLLTITQVVPMVAPAILFPDNYPTDTASREAVINEFKNNNYDLALSHFIALAQSGDKLSRFMAGRMYKNGEGIRSDLCQST